MLFEFKSKFETVSLVKKIHVLPAFGNLQIERVEDTLLLLHWSCFWLHAGITSPRVCTSHLPGY